MRVISNTTFIVDNSVEKEWVSFFRKNLIEALSQEETVKDIIFTKVSIDQPEGKTYSMQLIFDTEKEMTLMEENKLKEFRGKLMEYFGEKCYHFCSVLHEL